MTDQLLDFYNRELEYFRKLAREFAVKHPKIAGRLRLDDRAEDPHVSRLIEGFAYLNARLRLKIEDEFPELCQAMLNVLYPEYLAPFPSCTIIQFKLPESQFELTAGHQIPAGSKLTTQEIEGEPCRFRTSFPVDVWPFSLEDARVQTPPFTGPKSDWADDAKGVVRLNLKTYSERVTFDQLSLKNLRVFLKGDSRYVFDLYEAIMNNALGVMLASSDSDPKPVELDADCLKPVGFSQNECLLEYSPHSRLGYHLLTEFFLFPAKFLFFDICGLEKHLPQVGKASSLCIYIFIKQLTNNLNNLPPETFQLSATPAVNLFEQRCEPVRLTSTRSEFRVVPDARRPLANEIYQVRKVTLTSQDREQVELNPFYSANHQQEADVPPSFWVGTRRKAEGQVENTTKMEDLGTDFFLNIVGLDSKNRTLDFDKWTMDIQAVCLNRDYPSRLQNNTQITLESGSGLAESRCLVNPTSTIRPQIRDEVYWRLISHMSLNHISLLDNTCNTESLKEILRLYNFGRTRTVDFMVDGVIKVQAKRIVSRLGGELAAGFCKGTEIEITLNEEKFSGGGHFLFGCVLNHFFSLYASINSFTKTIVRTQQQDEVLCAWPPRSGEIEHV